MPEGLCDCAESRDFQIIPSAVRRRRLHRGFRDRSARGGLTLVPELMNEPVREVPEGRYAVCWKRGVKKDRPCAILRRHFPALNVREAGNIHGQRAICHVSYAVR